MQGMDRVVAIVPLISAQDAWKVACFDDIVTRPVRERGRELAEAREAYSRMLLERRVPRLLRRLLDHPQALKLLLRLIPRWKPTMAYVSLGTTMTAETAVAMSERWLQEQEARGRNVSGGHIFAYTAASGLSAEVGDNPPAGTRAWANACLAAQHLTRRLTPTDPMGGGGPPLPAICT